LRRLGRERIFRDSLSLNNLSDFEVTANYRLSRQMIEYVIEDFTVYIIYLKEN